MRASLYMAALPALRNNRAIRDFAAIMRKLIVIMNAVLKEGQASNHYGAA